MAFRQPLEDFELCYKFKSIHLSKSLVDRKSPQSSYKQRQVQDPKGKVLRYERLVVSQFTIDDISSRCWDARE
jgi:hypothetical protein